MNAPNPNPTSNTDPNTDLQQLAATDAETSAQVLALVQTSPITSAEQFTEAGEELKELKGEIKRITTARDEAVKPLQAVIDTIKGWFSPALSRLAEAEQTRKRQIGTYLEAKTLQENAARLALQAAVQEAVTSNAPDAGAAGANALAALALATDSAPKVKGISSSIVWDFEIVDISKIPREFLMPNESAIRAFVKASKREDAIPGVRAFPKTVIRAGSK